MIWISMAIVIVVTEILIYQLYLDHISRKTEKNENGVDYEDRIKALEDQVSNIRVAQGMRRRDG